MEDGSGVATRGVDRFLLAADDADVDMGDAVAPITSLVGDGHDGR